VSSIILSFVEEYEKGHLAELTFDEGKKFIRNFMDVYVSKHSKISSMTIDEKSKIAKINARIGINALEDNRGRACKCHGISGSCSVSTCWKTENFSKTVLMLKDKYHELKGDQVTSQLCHKVIHQWDIINNNVPTEKKIIINNKKQLQCTEQSIYYREYCGTKFTTSGRICYRQSLQEQQPETNKNLCDRICCNQEVRKERHIEPYDCERTDVHQENKICNKTYITHYCV